MKIMKMSYCQKIVSWMFVVVMAMAALMSSFEALVSHQNDVHRSVAVACVLDEMDVDTAEEDDEFDGDIHVVWRVEESQAHSDSFGNQQKGHTSSAKISHGMLIGLVRRCVPVQCFTSCYGNLSKNGACYPTCAIFCCHRNFFSKIKPYRL